MGKDIEGIEREKERRWKMKKCDRVVKKVL